MATVTANMLDTSRTVFHQIPNHTVQCSPLLPPARTTLKLIQGNGTSLGTKISFQCPPKHLMVGQRMVSCVWNHNRTQWTGEAPFCKPLPRNEDFGFRVAVIASIVSIAIILLMSMAFITCCLLKYIRKQERRSQEREAQMWHQQEPEEMQELSGYSRCKGRNNNNNKAGKQVRTAQPCGDGGKWDHNITYSCRQYIPPWESQALVPTSLPCRGFDSTHQDPAEPGISVVSGPHLEHEYWKYHPCTCGQPTNVMCV